MIHSHKPQALSRIQLYEGDAIVELLKGLALASEEVVQTEEVAKTSSHASNSANPIVEVNEAEDILYQVSDKMQCSYCAVVFLDREEQTSHYKTDWHRFNLKQRLKGKAYVTEGAFEEMAGGDLSSISGSDSDSSEEEPELLVSPTMETEKPSDIDDGSPFHVEGIGRRHPKVFFRNSQQQLLAIHRSVLHSKKNQPSSKEELITMATEMPSHMTWTLLMAAGGHFAGAVFERDQMVVHKTFHRYVVRAKRGTAQSTRDNQGNAPKSAGASLRRYNEAALTQNIHDTLQSWSDYLEKCDRIFVRASSSRNLFFSGKNPVIHRQDNRIRLIPFVTRRPTLKEVQRVHSMLSAVECFGVESRITDHIKDSPKKSAPKTESTENIAVGMAPKPDPIGAVKGEKKDGKDEEKEEEKSEESDDVELLVENVTFLTSELSEFGLSKEARKPRRTKKPKGKSGRTQEVDKRSVAAEDEQENIQDAVFMELRNDLYTASKVGDQEKLHQVLARLHIVGQERESQSQTLEDTSVGQADQPKHNETSSLCSPSSDENNKVALQNLSQEEVVGIDSTQESSVISNTTFTSDVLNKPFGDERTLLLVAASGGHSSLVTALMEAGADPTSRDKQGRTPYVAATDKQTRNEFRRFVAKYPDKYDYTLAQIPGPLTSEMEAEKKAKEADKKKAQRKARKEKLKERKNEEAQKVAEEKEKQRYLALSDREKRALAAEKRLAVQYQGEDKTVPVLSRCWECAADITGKVPFEYYDYKFCSPKCLKEHKLKNTNR